MEPSGPGKRLVRAICSARPKWFSPSKTVEAEDRAGASDPSRAGSAARAAPAEPLLPGEGKVLPLNTMRRKIAEHMVASKRTSPHVTTVMEADLHRVVAHYLANREAFSRDGVKLTYTAYFVSAAAQALRAFPLVNSSWTRGRASDFTQMSTWAWRFRWVRKG